MAKKVIGKIYQQGSREAYFLRYKFQGKDNRIRLLDTDGKPIYGTDDDGKALNRPEALKARREAEAAADMLLSKIRIGDKAEQLRQLNNDLRDAEAAAIEAEANMQNAIATLAGGWELFYSCPKRPKSCRKYTLNEIPRTSTVANYRAYYCKFSAWIAKHHRTTRLLSDVTEAQAIEFIEWIKTGNASGTTNKYLQFLKMLYETIIAAGKITCKNPFAEIEPEELTYNSKKPLTVEQIASLLDNAEGELKVLFALGYFTGLRRGDCCTLLWSEVDLLRQIIERIPRKIVGRVKDKSQAVVKVGIAPLLAGLLAETPANARRGYVLPEMGQLYDTEKDYIITNQIAAHFRRCGIETTLPGTGYKSHYVGKKKVYDPSERAVVQYGFHSLRYSYISHNAAMGTPAAVIQRNAGHSSPQMTEHYVKIDDATALQYACKLQLPGADQPDSCIEDDERAALHQLVDTLNIEQIRNLLAGIQNEGRQ